MRSLREPRLRLAALLIVAMAAPMAELAVLWVTGWSDDRALAAQVSAPGALGVFHDLRWLLVLHDAWWNLLLEAVGIWLTRALLDTTLARLAGVGGDAVSWSEQFRVWSGFTLFMLVVQLPWTVLAFGVDVVAISWLWFAAFPAVLFIALLSGHGGLAPRWWSRPPPRAALSWMAVAVGVEMGAGMAIQAAPAGLWLPLAAAAGAANGLVWRGLVEAERSRKATVRAVPLVPAIALGMVGVAVGGAAVSFAVVDNRTASGTSSPTHQTAVSLPGPPPVLIVSGFDSILDAATVMPDLGPYAEVRFSYRGLDRAGNPLPYAAADTHQSLYRLVHLLAAQVDVLHRQSGKLVDIVAESEGSLVARVYTAADPAAPIHALVLLSPLDQPGRVYYPTAGHDGYGLATGRALEVLSRLLDGISPIRLPADSPFLQSIIEHAPAVRNLLSCPTPGVDEAVLEPIADTLVDPETISAGARTLVLPAFHGGLLTNRSAQTDVSHLLSGATIHSDGSALLFERVLRLAGAAWQVPTLPLSVYANAGNHPSCSAMSAAVRHWIGPLTG